MSVASDTASLVERNANRIFVNAFIRRGGSAGSAANNFLSMPTFRQIRRGAAVVFDAMTNNHDLLCQRVRAQWRAGLDTQISAAGLLSLWARYKYVVLAHDQSIYRQIGPLLANLSGDVQARAEQVLKLVVAAMATPASRRNHLNALQHVAGHVKRSLTECERCQWQQALADYEAEIATLQVPAELLLGYLQRYGSDYVRAQYYPDFFLNLPLADNRDG